MVTVFSLCFRLITCQDSLNSFSNQCQKLGEAICGEFSKGWKSSRMRSVEAEIKLVFNVSMFVLCG